MTITLLTGDVRDVLPTLADASVHTVVTSPPYWNLRDYGTALWDGGDANCQHTFARNDARLMRGSNGELGKNCTSWTHRDATPPRVCSCGARRIDRQLGLEPTPDAYIAAMVAVFREVKRVLRPDGTVWCNLGDSYSGGKQGRSDAVRPNGAGVIYGGKWETEQPQQRSVPPGYKPKDLLLMPARLALALQADGWWVRSDIIWAKPNPMPESCTDRPTSAHEHVFLLTKRARYYYDSDAVREDVTGNQHPGRSDGGIPVPRGGGVDTGGARPSMPGGLVTSRSCRNVWTIATHAYPAAHFATYPPELAERCIRAGTSERGCCAACGAPWVRQVDKRALSPLIVGKHCDADPLEMGRNRNVTRMGDGWDVTTTGWSPSCQCQSLRCVSCCAVLDTRYENRKASTRQNVPDVRRDVQAVDATGGVLQPSLLRTAGEEAEANPLPSVREDIHATEFPTEAVFGVMRAEVDGPEPLDDERLDDNQQGLQAASEAGPSQCDTLRLCDGASAGDGEEARQASDFGRGSASQKRRQAGQPDQQPGANGKARARRGTKADLSCDVPALPSGVSDARQCPHCGSHADWTTPDIVPATVLDCFCGAGTTLLVADRLQRHAIGIDLNASYADLARRRIEADAPLFTSWAPAEDPADQRMADLFAEAAE